MAAPRLAVRPELARAKAGTIRLAAAQLLLLRAQRREWEQRMGELLASAPRHGPGKTPKDPDPGKVFPGGEIYLSMPGLGDRLAARVAGEIGEHAGQFTTPNALQCYAGRAPVTRRSGRSEFTIARRLAYNRHLGDAVQQWAFCSLTRSPWAREFYDAKIAAGKTHHAALRTLGNRWLEVLWHCLRLGVPYNEATHTANRNRARKTAA
jgi:transposase